MFAAIGEFQRDLINERAAESIGRAKSAGLSRSVQTFSHFRSLLTGSPTGLRRRQWRSADPAAPASTGTAWSTVLCADVRI